MSIIIIITIIIIRDSICEAFILLSTEHMCLWFSTEHCLFMTSEIWFDTASDQIQCLKYSNQNFYITLSAAVLSLYYIINQFYDLKLYLW